MGTNILSGPGLESQNPAIAQRARRTVVRAVKAGARSYRRRLFTLGDILRIPTERLATMPAAELVALLRHRIAVEREGLRSGHWAFRGSESTIIALRQAYVGERLAIFRQRAEARPAAFHVKHPDRGASLPQEKPMADDASFRVAREIEAAKVLLERYRDALGDDAEAVAAAIEGETDLFEKLDGMLDSIADDQGLVASIKERKANLGERQKRIERRIELKRSLVLTAIQVAEIRSHQFAACTVGRSNVAPKAIITEEADLPAAYFKQPPPVVDQQKVSDYYRERLRRLKDAAKIADENARKAAIDKIDSELPKLPGVVLTQGGEFLTISWK